MVPYTRIVEIKMIAYIEIDVFRYWYHLKIFVRSHLTIYVRSHLTIYVRSHLTIVVRSHLTMFVRSHGSSANSGISNLF